MRKRLLAFGFVLAMAAGTLGVVSADETVIVTQDDSHGWIVNNDGSVPVEFNGPASTGLGALHFGPVSGSVPANKFIMASPYQGPASELASFTYDFYIAPASAVGSDHFYVNVYVDSAANGIGTTASFYDCRYDGVPPGGTVGAWSTYGFSQSSAWTNVASPLAGCPATLAGLPAGSVIDAVVLNGGQSTASDAGLAGGFDNVLIETSDGVTTYDFEPVSGQCKKDGWEMQVDATGDAFADQGDCVSYYRTDGGNPAGE